jgi:hypothetical protein
MADQEKTERLNTHCLENLIPIEKIWSLTGRKLIFIQAEDEQGTYKFYFAGAPRGAPAFRF